MSINMDRRREIATMTDIKLLVNEFYTKVRSDEVLKNIFNNKIQDRWEEHLDKMYKFWQTVLLGERTYSGTPFLPHSQLPVELEHFNRWLSLFNETVDTHFIGEKAEQAKWQGNKMAEMFHYKIEEYRRNKRTPLK